jgi:hypothetical protein
MVMSEIMLSIPEAFNMVTWLSIMVGVITGIAWMTLLEIITDGGRKAVMVSRKLWKEYLACCKRSGGVSPITTIENDIRDRIKDMKENVIPLFERVNGTAENI